MRLLHREPDTVRDDTATREADQPSEREGWRSTVFGRRTRHDDTDTDTDDDVATGRHGRVGDETRAAVPYHGTDRDDRLVERDRRRRARVRRARRLEYAHKPFHIGNVLAMIGGAVLAVIGIVALVRGDLDDTWDRPLTTVLHIDHTPLTAALEIGAGVLLLLLAATGVRLLALVGAAGLAVAAAVVAIEPGRLASQYALETWWAWVVAGAAGAIALILLLPSRRRPPASDAVLEEHATSAV